jgi:putative membrane protein
VKGALIRIAATAVTFMVLPTLLPQVEFTGGLLQLVIVAVLFGIANGVVKPIAKLLSFPINMLTLGLFGLVINVALVLLVAWVADEFFQAGLVVGGFPTDGLSVDAIVAAFIVGIVLSVVQTIAGLIVKD